MPSGDARRGVRQPNQFSSWLSLPKARSQGLMVDQFGGDDLAGGFPHRRGNDDDPRQVGIVGYHLLKPPLDLLLDGAGRHVLERRRLVLGEAWPAESGRSQMVEIDPHRPRMGSKII